MTKVTIEISNAREVHIRIPHWVFKIIAANNAIWILSAAFFLYLAGLSMPAVALAGCGLLLLPVGMAITYLYWRFYWHITAWLMTFTTFLYALGVMTIITNGGTVPTIRETPLQNMVLSPLHGLILLGIIIVVMMLYLFLSRNKTKPHHAQQASPKPASDEIDFPKAVPIVVSPTQLEADKRTFQQRIANLVATKSGTRAVPEPNGTDISVYRGTTLVGIVKCVERTKAIAPFYVRDLAKQKEALAVNTAYLATPGSFTTETRQEAEKLGIRLIDGSALEKM